MECLFLIIICDEPRRPRRDAPAALQLPENSGPVLSGAWCRCQSNLHNFSWLGKNHSRSCPFQSSRDFLKKVDQDFTWMSLFH